MGTTPILKIPYVEATDLLANYPVADKAQADKMEAVVSPLVADTGWINLTPVSGTGACRYRVIGPNVWMRVNLTGMTSIANGANGPIVNAGAIPAAYCPGLPTTAWETLAGSLWGWLSSTPMGRPRSGMRRGARSLRPGFMSCG
jgi:hypothetical protein